MALSRAPHPDQPGGRRLVVDLAQSGAVTDVVTSVRSDVVIHSPEPFEAIDRPPRWRPRCRRISSQPWGCSRPRHVPAAGGSF